MLEKLLSAALAAAATAGIAMGMGLVSPSVARADGLGDALGLSPFWDWKTLETEHFRISFPKELEAHAQQAGRYLEEAHTLLSSRLRWTPRFRTQILVIDNADAANGLTSPFQRFGIVLQVTPPDNWFSTAYYDDWFRLLCYHEYTHLVNMDTATGLYKAFRVIFGDILLPNTFWPPWMLEGLAVYMETRLTGGGRGRSTFYDMVLRSAVESETLDTSKFVTLDRVNGTNPYFPGGETAYLFGYQLMNEVARNHKDSALGEMSYRSGGRVPYFINGNLENITGRDWYQFWDSLVAGARAHGKEQLDRIRSEPVTPVDRLTRSRASALGSAVSPDGKLLAYTLDSIDQRTGLWIRELATGKLERVGDKVLGVGMAFTPDSKILVTSEGRRDGIYYLWSDLRAYDVASGSRYWISDSLRARDPDISRDGKWIAFTLTEDATTGLAIAPLERDGDRIKLGAVKKVYWPERYGRVANPKFSPDGAAIVFSLHDNGKYAEDLASVELASGKLERRVADGRFNRFPAYDPEGRLYFVSDRTGVDNLFRLDGGKATQVSNVTTGLWLPSFGKDQAFASVASHEGWDLARIQLASAGVSSAKVTVAPPAAPEQDPQAKAIADQAKAAPAPNYPVSDYSVFPSIWPRQWAPLLIASPDAFIVGAQLFGFDATDRHRYLLGATYDGQIKKFDWAAYYANRSFGPTFSLFAIETFDYLNYVGGPIDRELDATAAVSYPIEWTHSSLTPSLEFGMERESIQYPRTASAAARDRHLTDLTYTGRLVYSDTEGARLAITSEAGRVSEVGARLYQSTYEGDPALKLLAAHTEYIETFEHHVLVPSVRASYVTRTRPFDSNANVEVAGRSRAIFTELSSDRLDKLRLRGYPHLSIQTRSAGIGSLDYRFPLARIFRGWGTNPLFLENLSGFVFGETAYFPQGRRGSDWLPSAGGGLRLDTDVFIHVPLLLTLEYDRGFQEPAGGDGEVFFKVGLGAIGF